jgi:uncharacterized membrane protein
MAAGVALSWMFIAGIVAAGTCASFVDSLLGATIQAQYRCRMCGKMTERRKHCGCDTELMRGSERMNNDAVNWSCAAAGALIGSLL